MLAEHGADLPPAVDPAQLDLPAGDEAEEQDKRTQRVHGTPLHCCLGPRFAHGTPQSGIAIGDAEEWCPKAASDEIGEAAFPRGKQFAAAQLSGEQVFVPVGENACDAQYRSSDHLSGTAHAQGEAVEER